MGPLAVDVKSYPSASASLEYLSGGGAALIFLDIIMPGKDGLTFLEELRSHPLHRDTPVVVMSSKDYRQDKGIARQLGAEYVTKPVASRTIQDLVIQLARAEPRAPRRAHERGLPPIPGCARLARGPRREPHGGGRKHLLCRVSRR